MQRLWSASNVKATCSAAFSGINERFKVSNMQNRSTKRAAHNASFRSGFNSSCNVHKMHTLSLHYNNLMGPYFDTVPVAFCWYAGAQKSKPKIDWLLCISGITMISAQSSSYTAQNIYLLGANVPGTIALVILQCIREKYIYIIIYKNRNAKVYFQLCESKTVVPAQGNNFLCVGNCSFYKRALLLFDFMINSS